MAFRSLLSFSELRQLVVVVAAVVVVICAGIGESSSEASRRLHRWEHDLRATGAECARSTTRHDKFELVSKWPDSSVQLHIRSNLPVSYDHDTPAT